MGSAKQQTAISKVMALLHEWDKGSKIVRKQILIDFVAQNGNKTGPELEAEFAQAASLFLTRLTAWLRLTYMVGTCLSEQLQALQIFLGATSGHKFMAEFLEVGGVLTLLEILGLKQAKEEDKAEALKLLTHVANAGRKHKELICESYGIRGIAECLAKSQSESTQEAARNLLQMLSNGNPRFQDQVYKGLIALLPCSSPKAQQMATQTLKEIQPMVKVVPIIAEPLLQILKSLHLEVQFEAIELIKLLMKYEVRDQILKGLIKLLKPSKEDTTVADSPDSKTADDDEEEEAVNKRAPPMPVYVQQAAAAKCLGVLGRESLELADRIIMMRGVHGLMVAMGNRAHADSQRQAAMTLEHLCRNFPIVDEHCREAMGDVLYEMFMADPEMLYFKMTPVQDDVLASNKINIAQAAHLESVL